MAFQGRHVAFYSSWRDVFRLLGNSLKENLKDWETLYRPLRSREEERKFIYGEVVEEVEEGGTREVTLAWAPPGVPSMLATKYLRSLPQEHLSIQVRENYFKKNHKFSLLSQKAFDCLLILYLFQNLVFDMHSGQRGSPAKACSPGETISPTWCWAWPVSSAFQRGDRLVSTAFDDHFGNFLLMTWFNVINYTEV